MTKAEAKRIARSDSLDDLHRWADEILSRARKASARHRPTREAKDAKREERRLRTANVRVEVFKRDGGRCVVCDDVATDMHHLVYGSGMRRVAESGKTCAAVCRTHHNAAHTGNLATLDTLAKWAAVRGYTFAANALWQRIDKIQHLRRKTA